MIGLIEKRPRIFISVSSWYKVKIARGCHGRWPVVLHEGYDRARTGWVSTTDLRISIHKYHGFSYPYPCCTKEKMRGIPTADGQWYRMRGMTDKYHGSSFPYPRRTKENCEGLPRPKYQSRYGIGIKLDAWWGFSRSSLDFVTEQL